MHNDNDYYKISILYKIAEIIIVYIIVSYYQCN